MGNVLNFSTDNVNAFAFLIDESGSMRDQTSNVIKGMQMFQKEFDDFSEAGSVVVSVSTFNEGLKLGDFKKVRELNFRRYNPQDGTWLCHSIVKMAKALKQYLYDVAVSNCVEPRGTLIVLSDGQPEGDPESSFNAIEAINELNMMGVTTVFCAFGYAISSEWGKRHGFQATINIDSTTTLQNFLGTELSKSCKIQSQSLKALGSDFFSKAHDTGSQNYSAKAATALEDEAWFEEI